MPKNTGIVGWAGLVLAILALSIAGYLFVSAHSSSSTGAINGGGEVLNNPSLPFGFYLGSQKNLTSGTVLSFGRGMNQASWLNVTGRTVYVMTGLVTTDGASAGNFKVSVGTTTTATVTDNFSLTAAPMWSQFIDIGGIATGTPAGIVADNAANHKTSFPSMIAVPANQRLTVVLESICKADGACGFTATSTSRGFTTVSFPIYYRL